VDKLFANGAVVDGILAFMVVELIVLILVRKKILPGLRSLELCVSIGAGAALLLALRAALLAQRWPLIGAAFSSALGCHVADLRYRWAAQEAIRRG
jgi:hypothetical protein